MTNEYEQRGTRESYLYQRSVSPGRCWLLVVPRPPSIYTPRRAHKPYNRCACKRELRKLAEWTESDHASERKRGVQASHRSRGTRATWPRRGLAPWPGGPS